MALLEQNPDPTDDDVRWAISGNICRCTGYMNIVKAIRAAAAEHGRPRGSVGMTTTQPKPTTTAEIGGIGHSVKRVEDDRFVAGQGNYLDDHTLPGMLHMAILRSPVAARAHQEHRHVGGGGGGRRGRGGHR